MVGRLNQTLREERGEGGHVRSCQSKEAAANQKRQPRPGVCRDWTGGWGSRSPTPGRERFRVGGRVQKVRRRYRY